MTKKQLTLGKSRQFNGVRIGSNPNIRMLLGLGM